MASDRVIPSPFPPPPPPPPVSIAEDIWPEILKRTPVKALFRFRCVCKSWNALISSPRFISDLRKFTASSAAPAGKFLFTKNVHEVPTSYALHYPGETPLEDVKYLDFPFHFPFQTLTESGFTRIADVIHGVICLVVTSFPASHVSAALWNPAIHKHFPLSLPPPSPELIDVKGYSVVGFGFDSASNDLKVVRLSSSRLVFAPPDCDVFSLREGRWRKPAVNRFPRLCQFPHMRSCFTRGTIHWIAVRPWSPDYYTVLAFDCERDELKDMDDHLPEEVRVVSNSFKTPKVFVRGGGHETLAVMQYSKERGGRCVLWVMDSYGVSSSWRKLFSVKPRALNYSLFGDEIVLNNRSPCNFKESLLLMDVGNLAL